LSVVIIGSSLTGMAISRTLSQSKIDHILIGKRPNNLPRLGESLNPEGTTEIINQFPEYSRFFFDKELTTIGIGEHLINCNLSAIGSMLRTRFFLNTLSPGLRIPREMVHVDRVGFDNALFEEIKKSPHLKMLDSLVEAIDYDKEKDVINSIRLQSGQSLNPRYVFDCTNHIRLLGRMLEIPVEFTSEKQKVIYTHFYKSTEDHPFYKWETSTNLLRLEKEHDGLDGFAWCIPLESYISVGASLHEGQENITDEEALELTEKAYLRRGLNFRNKFPIQKELMIAKGQYFIHDRSYGTNWSLSGPSFCQTWYMSGSGVGTSLSTAHMAPQLVNRPMDAGKIYHRYMKRFLDGHLAIDWFVQTDIKDMTDPLFKKKVIRWLMSNINRMALFPIIREKKIPSFLSRIATEFLDRNLISSRYFSFSKHCPVVQRPERLAMWDSQPILKVNRNHEKVNILFKIISGELPIKYVDKIMSPRVLLWMDKQPICGRLFWKTWVIFLRSRAKTKGLRFEGEMVKQNQGEFNILARWHADIDGKKQMSKEVIGRVKFDGDRIVDIRSHKKNYTFILGDNFNSGITFYLYTVKIFFWGLFNFKKILKST